MAQSVSIGSGCANCKPLHAVVFALPFQGHFNPAFHLTNKLAAKGVIVTFVHTEAFRPTPHPTSHLPSNPLHVRYAQLSDGLPLDFGSYARVSKAQIQEMAMGLLESKQSFVWALRPDIVASDVSDILPGGFLDEIKEQGVVVPWASQLQVLSHPSVGGFLSHCGWNSILESIWLGIPMLAFPLVADQYTNCKLITEEWRVAVRLGGSSRSINNSRALVGRDVIGRSVKEFMGGREGKEASRRVESMRDVLHTAATKGGSSYENLDHLLERIKLKANQRGGGAI